MTLSVTATITVSAFVIIVVIIIITTTNRSILSGVVTYYSTLETACTLFYFLYRSSYSNYYYFSFSLLSSSSSQFYNTCLVHSVDVQRNRLFRYYCQTFFVFLRCLCHNLRNLPSFIQLVPIAKFICTSLLNKRSG